MTAPPVPSPSLTEVAKPRQRVFLEQSWRERAAGSLWAIVWVVFFRFSPPPLHRWRAWLLRRFGARIEGPVWIASSARVEFPWNLRLGEGVFIAHEVIINCMGEVRIGDRTRISQYTHIVAGTHAYHRPDMRIVRSPIVIGKDVWIAADAFVGPGVRIGDGCLLAARGSAFHDLPPGQVCVGEPARPMKPWVDRSSPLDDGTLPCPPPAADICSPTMTLRIYNSLTKREEDFVPLDPAKKEVTFYSCGPTVYDFAHIGNFRSFLNADVMRRTLELIGYRVRHVMNITDVGHMTEDDVADGGGEDKMEAAARRLLEDKKSGKLPPDATEVDPGDPYAIANFYADAFLEDARTLGLKVAFEVLDDPLLMPRPTQYVPQMIEAIERLVDAGHAYVADDGVVYYDVQSFPDYGQLSGNTPDRIRSGEGGRVDEATQAIKRHPADFMLWKPDPTHLMRWPSPWGEGYPGWHLECSVMAMSLLAGSSEGVIDLHSGGEDNIFPHHECEIAQARGASGAAHFARYWFHTRFLIVENEKMSKSKGNFFTLRDLIGKGASPAAIRYELIKTHYRGQANFTLQGLTDAQRQIDRWRRVRSWLETHRDSPLPEAGDGPLVEALPRFTAHLCNDLNISGAIGVLSEAAGKHRTDQPPPPAGSGTATYATELEALMAMDSVIGVLDLEHAGSATAGVDEAWIDQKIAERNSARAEKDWSRADEARDELLAQGIAIKDGPEGTTWSKVVR